MYCPAKKSPAYFLRHKNYNIEKLPIFFTILLKNILAKRIKIGKRKPFPKSSPQFRRLRYADIIIPLFSPFGNSFFAFILRKLRQFYTRAAKSRFGGKKHANKFMYVCKAKAYAGINAIFKRYSYDSKQI